ncbi:MAG: site-specific DNA-methyltransferase [Chitinophagales bacterium]|jgi:adenine-specific DNA-methyltransferase|nr:site-specific DNA-methyltransferase [Chitinophagales bacterium]
MATGNPINSWQSNNNIVSLQIHKPTDNTVYLQYEGKKAEAEILLNKQIIDYITTYPLLTTQGKNELKQLYFSDNLNALYSFLENEQIKGKVNLIYIDPPYATQSVFQTHAQQDAYTDLLTGAAYFEFLRERLILLRELLAPTGSIYVHLDSNAVFETKMLMDEVFGAKNFRNLITRKKCNSKNYTRKSYGNISDYILFYTKTDNYTWNRPFDSWEQEKIIKEFPCVEKETNRRYKKVPIHAPGIRNGETGGEWRGMLPPKGKHWQYTPEKLDELDKKGEIYWSPTGNPRRKVYFDNSNGIPVQDIWTAYLDAYNQNVKVTGYPTEKNLSLLQRIIETSTNKNDLVLDCFCGSGTTLVAADLLSRNWIGVDSSQNAIDTIIQRLKEELIYDFSLHQT